MWTMSHPGSGISRPIATDPADRVRSNAAWVRTGTGRGRDAALPPRRVLTPTAAPPGQRLRPRGPARATAPAARVRVEGEQARARLQLAARRLPRRLNRRTWPACVSLLGDVLQRFV